jgi:hypothetical protein
MARQYSDQSYGGHQVIKLGPVDVSAATNAGATAAMAHKFLYPAKVIAGNVVFLTAVANDLGTCTSWLLQKSTDAQTGISTFGIADVSKGTDFAACTYALGESLDMTVTETSFSAGDEVVFTIEGTTGAIVSNIAVYLEITEDFVESDS